MVMLVVLYCVPLILYDLGITVSFGNYNCEIASDREIRRIVARFVIICYPMLSDFSIQIVTVRLSVIGKVMLLPDVLVGISRFGPAETQLGFTAADLRPKRCIVTKYRVIEKYRPPPQYLQLECILEKMSNSKVVWFQTRSKMMTLTLILTMSFNPQRSLLRICTDKIFK